MRLRAKWRRIKVLSQQYVEEELRNPPISMPILTPVSLEQRRLSEARNDDIPPDFDWYRDIYLPYENLYNAPQNNWSSQTDAQ